MDLFRSPCPPSCPLSVPLPMPLPVRPFFSFSRKSSYGSGQCCELSSGSMGKAKLKLNLMHFNSKIWRVMSTILLTIVIRIHWANIQENWTFFGCIKHTFIGLGSHRPDEIRCSTDFTSKIMGAEMIRNYRLDNTCQYLQPSSKWDFLVAQKPFCIRALPGPARSLHSELP